MTLLPIRLNWQRPRDGVSIDEGTGEPQSDKEMRKVRVRSDRMEPVTYNVANLESPIALHFVNCVEDEDFTTFLTRFGMLDAPGISNDPWCNMSYLRSFKEDIAAIFDLGEFPNSVGKAQHVNGLIRHVELRPTFECSQVGSSRLVLEPLSLLDLMMMEAVFAVEVGASLARCSHCSKAYLTGPLTGRRSHAVYCSDRCRVAAMRARNAAKGRLPEGF